jgi:hypothetical protein
MCAVDGSTVSCTPLAVVNATACDTTMRTM